MAISSTKQFVLEDFLTHDVVQARIKQGRYRAAHVFARARHPLTNRGSRNCIMDSGPKLGDLCLYVMDRSPRRLPLFSKTDIPQSTRNGLSQREEHAIVDAMQLQVMLRALVGMRDIHEIYQLDGDWLIVQAVADESIKERERVRRVKRDDRSYHGRPKRDRFRPRVVVNA